MIDNFRKMKETTENTVNNKFRQMADNDCKDIGKNITNTLAAAVELQRYCQSNTTRSPRNHYNNNALFRFS